jgi:hypothetical protein
MMGTGAAFLIVAIVSFVTALAMPTFVPIDLGTLVLPPSVPRSIGIHVGPASAVTNEAMTTITKAALVAVILRHLVTRAASSRNV